jgi:hypothetical protein
MCDGAVEIPLPGKNPETKMPYTKAQRVKLARLKAQEKGWSVTKGADACPRVHSMIPQPDKARDRVDAGAPPCNHQERAGIVTNQPGTYDRKRPHVSVAICGDPGCRAATLGYVHAKTGEIGVYISDSDRRRAAA